MYLSVLFTCAKEPSTLNYFLEPLVKELKCLWKGVRIATNKQQDGTKVRAARLCCTADVPALRKLCGFLGHSANLGCSKCLKMTTAVSTGICGQRGFITII